jgi:3-oxoacyl-[acyl-carrier protein] reductase
MTSFHAKTALVTGASRGIGAAVSEALADKGCNLVITALHHPETLERRARELSESYGVMVTPRVCDAGDPKQVEALFDAIPRLDFLINNAGISITGLIQDLSPDEWDRLIRTNLSSCFYTARLAIPKFLAENTGAIVNISSVWGDVGAAAEAAYSASKGGVAAFTRALGKELAPSGIPVNAVACGFIDTAMNAAYSPEERDAIRDEIPADRFGTPEDVADTVVHLLEMPPYLTGQVVRLDGGWI